MLARRLTAASLLLLSLCSALPASGQTNPSFDESWRDIATTRLNAIISTNAQLSQEVDRLEVELIRAQQDLGAAANPNCVDIDCEQLEAVYYLVSRAEASAETSARIAQLAVKNWEAAYRNQRGSVSAIRAGSERLDNLLFAQDVAMTIAELSALMATGGAGVKLSFTGSATEIGARLAREHLSKFVATATNYTANKIVNSYTEYQTGTGRVLGQLSDETVTNSALQSLGSQLTRFALIRSESAGNFSWSPRAIGNPIEKFRAAEVGTQVLIGAVTSGAVSELEGQARQAALDLQTALQQQQAYIRIMAHTRVAAVEAAENRLEIIDLKNRIERLRGECNRLAAAHSCGIEYERSLNEAEAAYNETISAATAESETAANQLEALRQQRDRALAQTQEYHEQLRLARDQVSTSAQTTTNRALIEELARNATDPEVRERYQQQLDALDGGPGVGAQTQNAAQLEQQRESAWQDVERLNREIAQASQTALATYSGNDAVIGDAQILYIQTLSNIEQAQLDCLEALRPVDLPSLSQRSTSVSNGGEYGPDEIFLELSQSLDALRSRITPSRISAVVREDAECSINYEFAGCWQLDNPLHAMDMVLERSGNQARARLMTNNDPFFGNSIMEEMLFPEVYLGTWSGNQLSLNHVYSAADRAQLRRLIQADDEEAVINALLANRAQSSLEGVQSENVTITELDDLPIGSLDGSGISINVLDINIRLMNYDLQPSFLIADDNSPSCPAGAIYLEQGLCIVPSDTERTPSFLEFSALQLEQPYRWIALENIGQFASNPLIYDEPISENAAMDTLLELGDRVWLETTSRYACDFAAETVYVRIEPERNPQSGFVVELKETAANSGVFRSDQNGIPLEFSSSDVMNGPTGNIRFYIEGQPAGIQNNYNFITIYE